MPWSEFFFSSHWKPRLARHFVFWLAWWLYFSCFDYFLQLPVPGQTFRPLYVTLGTQIMLNAFQLMLVYAAATYCFLYYLLPRITSGQWWAASFGLVWLSTGLVLAGYFMYWKAFPYVDSLFGPYRENSFPTRLWPAIYLGLVNPTKVMAAAGIIKLLKQWWLKQQAREKLAREKIATELGLLKAQIHPAFLLNMLHNISRHSQEGSPLTPGLLLKLSDLLSYMLYECDGPLVSLEKEISMMKDYMDLERISMNNNIDLQLNTRGDLSGKMIAPFLLLPFIENSFKQFGNIPESRWINMDISLAEDNFHMKLANGLPSAEPDLPETSTHELANVQKRLSILYPKRHELRMQREQEMHITHLKINLGTASTAVAQEAIRHSAPLPYS